MMSFNERTFAVNDQISQISRYASQLSRKIKSGLTGLWIQVRDFAASVSGNKQSMSGIAAERAQTKPADQATMPVQQDTFDQMSRIIEQQKQKKYIKPIRRLSRQRVYRLQGYTTVTKINARRKSEKRQRVLRQLLLILVIILVIILLFRLYNPIQDISEWYRIIGIRDMNEMTGITPTVSPSP